MRLAARLLLVFALAFGGQISAGAAGAAGESVVLCGPDGKRTLLLNLATGAYSDPEDHAGADAASCAACCVLMASPALPVGWAGARGAAGAHLTDPFRMDAAPAPGFRHLLAQSRAPPLT